MSLAEERRGKGGVVFAHNLAGVQELAGALRGAGHRVATLTGADNAQDKAKTRRRFRAGEIDIIVSSDAGSIGANLQHRGEWVVNYDLPMTQKTLEQRNGRIDRIGQARAIELHHLMTNTEHDQANYERLERKRLLGGIMQGPWESMDDTGLALNIKMASAARPTPRQGPAAESQMGLFG